MTVPDHIIRAATEADLPAIVDVHLAAYSRHHFTSRLGHGALIDYYRLFLQDGAEIIVLVPSQASREGNKILGFAVFGRGIAVKIDRFKRTNAPAILKASIAHPIAAGSKVLHRLWNRATHGQAMISADYLLLSIAVANPGTGAGGILLDAFLKHAKASGTKSVGLYVNADNVTAINAYARRGFAFRELYGRQFYMDQSI